MRDKAVFKNAFWHVRRTNLGMLKGTICAGLIHVHVTRRIVGAVRGEMQRQEREQQRRANGTAGAQPGQQRPRFYGGGRSGYHED